MKGKARKAEIELLNYRLLKEFGIEPQREAKEKKLKIPPPRPKQKAACKNEDDDDDGERFGEKISSVKTSVKRGFTSIAKD